MKPPFKTWFFTTNKAHVMPAPQSIIAPQSFGYVNSCITINKCPLSLCTPGSPRAVLFVPSTHTVQYAVQPSYTLWFSYINTKTPCHFFMLIYLLFTIHLLMISPIHYLDSAPPKLVWPVLRAGSQPTHTLRPLPWANIFPSIQFLNDIKTWHS